MSNQPVAVVTGSSSGIGEATARALAADGFTVVINSATSVEAGERLAAELAGASYVQADIANPADAQRLIDTTLERHQRLDVLVNNAGTTESIPHADLDAVATEHWQRILGVNVIGTWQVSVVAVKAMGGSGHIINISSTAGSRPVGSSIPYAVSKAAVNHMTRLLANTLGPAIRVNAVAPGLIATPWTKDFTDTADLVTARAPLRRVGQPDDVAFAVLGLVNAPYITGEVIHVDGGANLI